MKGLLSIILIVFILLVALAIGSQNDSEITVNYIIAQSDIRISTFIAITLGLGITVGVLLVTPALVHAKVKLALLKQKVQ